MPSTIKVTKSQDDNRFASSTICNASSNSIRMHVGSCCGRIKYQARFYNIHPKKIMFLPETLWTKENFKITKHWRLKKISIKCKQTKKISDKFTFIKFKNGRFSWPGDHRRRKGIRATVGQCTFNFTRHAVKEYGIFGGPIHSGRTKSKDEGRTMGLGCLYLLLHGSSLGDWCIARIRRLLSGIHWGV